MGDDSGFDNGPLSQPTPGSLPAATPAPKLCAFQRERGPGDISAERKNKTKIAELKLWPHRPEVPYSVRSKQ